MRIYPDIWAMPYGRSPITFFVGQVEAPLTLGSYVFNGALTNFLTQTPLVPQSLYWFLDWNFSVDVAEADYTAAIVRTPLVSVYERARPKQPVFRQPFPVPIYYANKWILQGFRNLISPNELLFSIEGLVGQTPALLGKTSIRATVQFTAYEITDQALITRFLEGLDVPAPPKVQDGNTAPGGPMESLAKLKSLNPTLKLEGGLVLPAGRP